MRTFCFPGVSSMQPSRVLHQRAFPGHPQGQEPGIASRVVESFSDVLSSGQKQPLFSRGNRGKLLFDLPPLLRGSSSSQHDDVSDKALQTLMQVLEVILAFRRQEGGA